MQSIKDEILIRKAKKKDADAFILLMQSNLQKLYQTAYSILLHDEDAADAVQDTILSCWENIGELKENRYFSTWMTRILINKCYDIQRKNSRYSEPREWEEPATCDRYSVEWKEALAGIDEKYRTVLILYYSHGYRVSEISAMLDRPESTIRTQLQRGREQIAKYYQDAE